MGKKVSPMKGMQMAMKGKMATALGPAAPASLLEDTEESKSKSHIREDTLNSTESPPRD